MWSGERGAELSEEDVGAVVEASRSPPTPEETLGLRLLHGS